MIDALIDSLLFLAVFAAMTAWGNFWLETDSPVLWKITVAYGVPMALLLLVFATVWTK